MQNDYIAFFLILLANPILRMFIQLIYFSIIRIIFRN